jgi:N-acetyl-gamma-glutamyl-phosphate reductase
MPNDIVNAAILGASGYTGTETLRLLLGHPYVRVVGLTGDRQAGKEISEVAPGFIGQDLPLLTKIDDTEFDHVDVVFACLPHGAAQETVANLPDSIKVIDLSADFRLQDRALFEEWYGEHKAPHLQPLAVYGLTEWYREKVAGASLVANPGCYPTASLLPLLPLLEKVAILPETIVIDAKSGVSGAGKALREGSLAAEVQEGFAAYAIGRHRHLPEIEQACAWVMGRKVPLAFTPHLLPMNRGILATIYAKLSTGVTVEDVRAILRERYEDEVFVQVFPEGQTVSTRFVRGSNSCHLSVHSDNRPGHVIITSAIDNLLKGAAGQAVQNMNVLYGWAETTGLPRLPMYP